MRAPACTHGALAIQIPADAGDERLPFAGSINVSRTRLELAQVGLDVGVRRDRARVHYAGLDEDRAAKARGEIQRVAGASIDLVGVLAARMVTVA